MNLLLINYEYPPVGGGAATATWEMARALVKLGHRPVVLTARFRDRCPAAGDAGITVIEVPAIRRRIDRCTIWEMGTFMAGALLRIREVIRHEKIDGLIAFFSMPCGPIAWWGWRKTKIPYVVSLRGGDVPGNETGLSPLHAALASPRRMILRHAQAIVANSQGLSDAAKAADGFPVRVIENGVDTNFFHPAHEPRPSKPFRLLFVGRLQPQKNLPWLLRQLARIQPKPADWEIHIVGDGPERSRLEAQAEQLGLHRAITWHGWLKREALAKLYRESSCFVNASSYEGMPNAVLEAMASGLPVLLSDHPAHRSLLSDAAAGKSFGIDNDQEFSRVLAEAMRDSDGRQAMAVAARKSTLLRFSWEQTARRYLEIFEAADAVGKIGDGAKKPPTPGP